MTNILLSYPRSGNHLCRFFIELLTELPTFGLNDNVDDIEIYKNIFSEKIPFNISKYNKRDCYYKLHFEPEPNFGHINKLIFIIRNPKEVLLRHSNYKLNYELFNKYFQNINYYNNFKGKKLLLFYEDILIDQIGFINKLYNFLSLNNEYKKKFVIDNIDKLFNLSLNGKGRSWGGNLSNNELNFYYNKIPIKIKKDFDQYINNKLQKYSILEKYK